MSTTHTSKGRYTAGFIFIILGSLLMLNSLDVIDFSISPFFSFPMILFIVGIIIFINSQKKTFGLILASVGGVMLIEKIFPWMDIDWSIIFPVLIIALGVYIIFKRRNTQPASEKVFDQDTLDEVSVFGGGSKNVYSNNFKGGNITAIFGGSEIDLRESKLAEGNQVIDILCIFGGTEIHVPNDWNVILNVTPIFGGFSNKSFRNPNKEIDPMRTLVVKGVVIFGGGEIK